MMAVLLLLRRERWMDDGMGVKGSSSLGRIDCFGQTITDVEKSTIMTRDIIMT
jgi:hypothetical protein